MLTPERRTRNLNRKRKRSSGQQLDVFNASESFQQDPKRTQQIKLHELNRDCLMEIFIKLEVRDLLQLRTVHPNFEEPVRRVFAVSYLELRPSARSSVNELFGEVMEYASPTAKRIKIFQSTPDDLMGEISPFPKLTELWFKFGEISAHQMRLKNWCPNLTHLYFYGVTFPDSHFIQHIPLLQHISLKEIRNVNARNLMQFFENNPQLKSLQFEYPGEFTREYFSTMNRHLPMLEKLEIGFDNFLFFAQNVVYEPLYFPKLKWLSIHAHEDHYTHILNNLAISNETLEVLEFNGKMSVGSNSTNPLTQYTNLKKIHFNSRFFLNNLSVLECLPKLEVVYLDERKFGRSLQEMIDVVRHNKSLKFVQFESVRDDNDVKLNLKFFKDFCSGFENRDDLVIKMMEHERHRYVEISNKTLCIGDLIDGRKGVKYSVDDEEDESDNENSSDDYTDYYYSYGN